MCEGDVQQSSRCFLKTRLRLVSMLGSWRMSFYYDQRSFTQLNPTQIVMCLLVTRAPCSTLAPSSVQELDKLCELFEQASSKSQVASNNVVRISNLVLSVYASFDDTCFRKWYENFGVKDMKLSTRHNHQTTRELLEMNLTGLVGKHTLSPPITALCCLVAPLLPPL